MKKQELIQYAAQELMNKGNIDVIPEIFNPSYVAHAGNKKYSGHEFLRRWTKQLHKAITEIKVQHLDFLMEDENSITWQRSLSGKHLKDLRGIPASGKKVRWTEMVVSRFQKDMIAEEWVVSELAGELMLRQPIQNH
ncbi:MAG: hypothetical protein GC181_04750 [Bacteroidetes bacterium]|nr:hypothetical protein [Bacteroidota bacterium]